MHADGVMEGSDLRPSTFQKAVAWSWFVLAAAFGLIAARALVEGYSSWWAWAVVTALCVGVAALNWYARRVLPWLHRARGR